MKDINQGCSRPVVRLRCCELISYKFEFFILFYTVFVVAHMNKKKIEEYHTVVSSTRNELSCFSSNSKNKPLHIWISFSSRFPVKSNWESSKFWGILFIWEKELSLMIKQLKCRNDHTDSSIAREFTLETQKKTESVQVISKEE